MKKRLLSFFLSFFVIISSFVGTSVTASAWTGIGTEDDPWLIGKNNPSDVKAVYNFIARSLTISGTGDMTDNFIPNVFSTERMPWINASDDISTITIKDGVGSIGEFAFLACYNIKSMTIPESVKTIGKYAFYNCWGMKEIKFNDGLQAIGTQAFFGCSSLETINLPASLTSFGEDPFFNCKGLKTINFNGTEEQWESLTNKVSIPFGISINCTGVEPADNNDDDDESNDERQDLPTKIQKPKVLQKVTDFTIKKGKSKTVYVKNLFIFKRLQENPNITYTIKKTEGLGFSLKNGKLVLTGNKKGTFTIRIIIHIGETDNYLKRDIDTSLKVTVK